MSGFHAFTTARGTRRHDPGSPVRAARPTRRTTVFRSHKSPGLWTNKGAGCVMGW